MRLFGWEIGRARSAAPEPQAAPVVPYDSLPTAFAPGMPSDLIGFFDGEKFPGGLGTTLSLRAIDYWAIRERSNQLFNENLYAAGMVDRMVTNEIGSGLWPEAAPAERVLGLAENALGEWTEDVETRWSVWASTPELCDWKRQDDLASLSRKARATAIISGDVLVVLHPDPDTGLPRIELIASESLGSPMISSHKPAPGNHIVDGVEKNGRGEHVAFWVVDSDDFTWRRIPARGSRTGRRLAWLQYGDHKQKFNGTRGISLLAVVMQSLKELDRYRDALQRKAVVNSILAYFIKREKQSGPASLPSQTGAQRRDVVTVTEPDGKTRRTLMSQHVPGLVIEELNVGEEPVSFQNHVELDYGKFEEAVVNAIAWSRGIPPEILRLSFSNNYSASQAAINEYKMHIGLVWSWWGSTFYAPVYEDWLLSEVMSGAVVAKGMYEAWRDPAKRMLYAAWMQCEWYGTVKPSTDMLKQAKGSELLIANGWSTNARESRILTGTKFSANVRRQLLERQALLEVKELDLKLKKKYPDAKTEPIAK